MTELADLPIALLPRQLQGIIRWEAPPDPDHDSYRRRHRRSWAIVALELRRNPGKWAVIEEGTANVRNLANRITTGQGPWAPARSYQTATRSHDGTSTLYAVYVGPNGEYADQADTARETASNPSADRPGFIAGPRTAPHHQRRP